MHRGRLAPEGYLLRVIASRVIAYGSGPKLSEGPRASVKSQRSFPQWQKVCNRMVKVHSIDERIFYVGSCFQTGNNVRPYKSQFLTLS
jgi:hypothetical protein